jgi:hypothetical protein
MMHSFGDGPKCIHVHDGLCDDCRKMLERDYYERTQIAPGLQEVEIPTKRSPVPDIGIIEGTLDELPDDDETPDNGEGDKPPTIN